MVNRCPHCDAVYPPEARICPYCGVLLHASSRRLPLILPTGKLTTGFVLKQRYRIIEQVGKGGFSAVYKAVDTYFSNRIVAIKEMSLSKFSPNETFEVEYTFNQEVRMLANLTHPNLPRIYDNFPHAGRQYLVMDFIEGETLDHYLYETMSGHVPIQEVLDFGIQVCNVLGYLHTRRPPIIFRDLKPLNIIRTPDGLLYLIDFGIARYFKIGRDRDTIPFGTSGYTAPELAYQQSNPSSDIYSLGVTLYELLTANDPMHNPIRSGSLRLHNRIIPAELEKLIMQMIDGDPRRRPHNLSEVKQHLQNLQVKLSMRVKNSSLMRRAKPSMIFHSRLDASVRMSTLYVKKGIVPGEIFEINKRVMIIGRSNDSDIFLADMLVSRSHATLQNLNKGHSTIRDNESINGTFVNGLRLQRFQKYLLQDGDEIQLGDTVLIYREGI